MLTCARLLTLALLLPAAAFAATDSNLPEEGPVQVADVPADVMAAAQARCSGLLATKASFNWSRDTGIFVIEGRCQGDEVRIFVTGDGRIDFFTKLDRE